MGIFFMWIFFTVVVGIIGSNRKIGFGVSFLLSLILSPIIGLIFTLISPSLASVEYKEMLLKEQQKTNELLRGGPDIAGRLERLESLRDRKVISQEEFQDLKAKELAK